MVIPAADLAQTRAAILEGLVDDWVGLWVIPWWLRRLAPEASDDEMREATVALVREMCEANQVRVGDLAGPQDFRPWAASPDDAASRIDSEWQRLGRPPNIGEVAWLAPP